MNLLKYIRNVNEIMEDLKTSNGKALEHLKELHDSLILEQATNNMDKAKKSRAKTISDLIKKCNYEKFKGIFEDGGKWCFVNGFILFTLNDKVERTFKPLILLKAQHANVFLKLKLIY